jgi:hypothetical protein
MSVIGIINNGRRVLAPGPELAMPNSQPQGKRTPLGCSRSWADSGMKS